MRRAIALVLALLMLCAAAPAEQEEAEMLRLLAVNVGKADCLLLLCGGDVYMIDTGTAESYGAVSRALQVWGIERLTGVILTHTHKDHAGGAYALAQSPVAVDAWYASAYYAEVSEKEHPAVLAAGLRGEGVHWLRAGDSLPLDGGRLSVLGPTEVDEKENNNSLVLLAEAAGGSMLLCGDMEFPEEEKLAAAGLLRPVDVLKVGNHGNPDATSNTFVSAIRPRAAVISTDPAVDTNTPSKRVLKALQGVGAQIAVTNNAAQGVLAEIADGAVTLKLGAWPELPQVPAGLQLYDRDAAGDSISLRNSGAETVELAGWFIRSERGGEIFVFPAGAALAPGESLTVTGQKADRQGDYSWPDKQVWHKKKDDAAVLYDAWGQEAARLN